MRGSPLLALALVLAGCTQVVGLRPPAQRQVVAAPPAGSVAAGKQADQRGRLEARLSEVEGELLASARGERPADVRERLADERLRLTVALARLDAELIGSAQGGAGREGTGEPPSVAARLQAAEREVAASRERAGREPAEGPAAKPGIDDRLSLPRTEVGSSPPPPPPPPMMPSLPSDRSLVNGGRAPHGRGAAVVADVAAPAGVMEAVHAHAGPLQACWPASLAAELGLLRIDVRARVAADGRLRQAQVQDGRVPSSVWECLRSVLQEVRVPVPTGASRVVSFSLWMGT